MVYLLVAAIRPLVAAILVSPITIYSNTSIGAARLATMFSLVAAILVLPTTNYSDTSIGATRLKTIYSDTSIGATSLSTKQKKPLLRLFALTAVYI